MLEKVIEQHLMKKVKTVGGVAYKFTSPQRRSVPDRLCLFPGGYMVFVEVKNEKGKMSSGQERERQRLIDLGFPVFVVRSKEEVDHLVASYTLEGGRI